MFTLVAIGGVLLALGGAWWIVRLLRARGRPRPHTGNATHEERVHSSHTSDRAP